MEMLTVKDVKKSFDGVEILKGISLTVEKGGVLAIIGPSGSGKSTLLRCITQLETVDAGEKTPLRELRSIPIRLPAPRLACISAWCFKTLTYFPTSPSCRILRRRRYGS